MCFFNMYENYKKYIFVERMEYLAKFYLGNEPQKNHIRVNFILRGKAELIKGTKTGDMCTKKKSKLVPKLEKILQVQILSF